MPVVLFLAAIAILAGVVVVAIGRGGELTIVRSDVPPLRLEFATAADMARFRPPPAFFGYSAQVTDDALQRIAGVVADREAELASLRRQLAALRASSVPASSVPASSVPASSVPVSYPPASSAAAAAAGAADASTPAGRPPEPGGWAESAGWAESEPEPESGGWPESEVGIGPGGWAEPGSEVGIGPAGWAEAGAEPEGRTGPAGSEPASEGATGPGAGTVTHGEDLDPGLGGPGR